jgi:thiamine-phosphate pyrophosphorylase
MRGLYAIVDTKFLATREVDPMAYARALLEARPAALQLRAKDVPAREILTLLRALRMACRQFNVPLVLNDRADLAALAGCEIVHIGQDDLPYDLVHRIAPQLAVGISTHTPEQLERALAFKPSYVAYGPIYETSSKPNPDPVVGVEGLKEASRIARAAGVPLVAIGGLTLARIHEVAPYVEACAVISDLFLPGFTMKEVTERAKVFQAAIVGETTPTPPEAHP